MENKIIGLIGGIAPPSTIDYYQKITEGYREKTKTNDYPSLLINSINMTKMLEFVSKKEFEGLVDYLTAEIKKLENGGANFAVLASNTPHIVFDRLQTKTGIPLISIVKTTVMYAKKCDLKKLGLFGTKFTMQGGFYQHGFTKEKMDVIIPSIKSQEYIHEKYMNEFVRGIFPADTKKALIDIANEMIEKDGIEGLILGGTELPFILQEKDFKGIKLLNTTEIHVESILEYALKN